jgi:hypothetical protein
MSLKGRPTHISDPKHWLARAGKARAAAEGMTDPVLKQRMFNVAGNFKRLAKRASADKQRLEGFKETARMLGIDENSKAFERAFAKLIRETQAADIEGTRPAQSMTKE